MTPQQIEAMKLALEALDIAQGMLADLRSQHQPKMLSAYTAIKEALAEHAMSEVQRLGQEIEQKIGCVNHDCDQCKAQPEQEPCVHAKTPKGCYRVRCQLGDKCVDDEMSFQTTPPQRKPLTDEMKKQMRESCDSHEMRGAFVDGWLSAEAAHGIWPENSDCHGPDWTDRDGEYLK